MCSIHAFVYILLNQFPIEYLEGSFAYPLFPQNHTGPWFPVLVS